MDYQLFRMIAIGMADSIQTPTHHLHKCSLVELVPTHMQSHSHMRPHTLAACEVVHNDLHIPKHAHEHTRRRNVGGRTAWENVSFIYGQADYIVIVMSFTKIRIRLLTLRGPPPQ